ncbi:unnamed protein product [Rodentolepis nana]|uniref:Uncharacterized protein n=1 Tax=Rodentolepis nana TaxID=102285 RepID=A0A3P7RUX2_RODNA|nr:unnamed protein product [Rodentolepis nana]
MRETSSSSGFTANSSGRTNGASKHALNQWKDHDSESSSLSNFRDVSSHNNSHLE